MIALLLVLSNLVAGVAFGLLLADWLDSRDAPPSGPIKGYGRGPSNFPLDCSDDDAFLLEARPSKPNNAPDSCRF